MYGSATELVMTFGQGVERFILDPSLGEFIHIGESIKMPLNGKKVYSVNEGNYLKWDPVIQDAVQKYKDPKDGSKPYSMRSIFATAAAAAATTTTPNRRPQAAHDPALASTEVSE